MIYLKACLVGAGFSLATLVLLLVAAIIYNVSHSGQSMSSGGMAAISVFWPLALVALAFVGGFVWMVRRQGT